MAKFISCDHDQLLLLPPSLNEWVPKDDLVHFVIEAVADIPLANFRSNDRGTGSDQYHPHMMLSLLIYCYSCGIFSSRRIERATWRDLCVRYLTADQHPDHDTISKFRRENAKAIEQTFLYVLKLARELKLLKVGTISVDGTKIDANASKDKNVRYDRAVELEAQLQADIEALMTQAEQADNSDVGDGRELPAEITRRETLRDKMRNARKALEDRAKAAADKERAEFDRKVAERNARKGSAKGCHIKPPQEEPKEDSQQNLTDGDSRLMRKSKRSSYQQAYNAQSAVDADGTQLVLGAYVSQCASDRNELFNAVRSVCKAEVGKPIRVLADNGYASGVEVKQVEAEGIDVLVSVHAEQKQNRRLYDFRPACAIKEKESKETPMAAPWIMAMAAKLEDPENRRAYAKRKQTVEPVFGIIKHCMKFRQFLLRGIEGVNLEWKLVTLAYNFRRVHAMKMVT